MSTGRSEAKRAEKKAFAAAEEQRVLREQAEDKAKRQREKAQKLFMRSYRARLGGGFLDGGSGGESRGTLG